MIDTARYKVKPGAKIRLQDYSTKRDEAADRREVEDCLMPANIQKLSVLQEKLYAENTRACGGFQAMDAGKRWLHQARDDGIGPQGVFVSSFKAPSSEENDHDYLWRIHQKAPRRGEIGVFNRSHYEDVLVLSGCMIFTRAPNAQDRLRPDAGLPATMVVTMKENMSAGKRRDGWLPAYQRRAAWRASFRAFTTRTKTGNFPPPTSKSASIGISTCRPMRTCCPPPPPPAAPGTYCRPTASGLPATWCRRFWRKNWNR